MKTIIQDKTAFVYHFVPQGSKVKIDDLKGEFLLQSNGDRTMAFPKESAIILDVGNHLSEGVIDLHHLMGGYQWNGGASSVRLN